MARVSRKKLKICDEESINNLMIEIYNQTHINQAKATSLYTKWSSKIKDMGEIAAIGDQILKLIGADAKIVDQKLMILKLLKETLDMSKKNPIGETLDNTQLSSDSKQELMKMIEEAGNKQSKN